MATDHTKHKPYGDHERILSEKKMGWNILEMKV